MDDISEEASLDSDVPATQCDTPITPRDTHISPRDTRMKPPDAHMTPCDTHMARPLTISISKPDDEESENDHFRDISSSPSPFSSQTNTDTSKASLSEEGRPSFNLVCDQEAEAKMDHAKQDELQKSEAAFDIGRYISIANELKNKKTDNTEKKEEKEVNLEIDEYETEIDPKNDVTNLPGAVKGDFVHPASASANTVCLERIELYNF